MKRIIFLFSTLLAVNIFACEGAFHDTLQEVKALKRAGYQNEASTLMHELIRSDIFNFSGAQIKCYSKLSRELNRGPVLYKCNNCSHRFMDMGSRVCPNCGSSDTEFAAW